MSRWGFFAMMPPYRGIRLVTSIVAIVATILTTACGGTQSEARTAQKSVLTTSTSSAEQQGNAGRQSSSAPKENGQKVSEAGGADGRSSASTPGPGSGGGSSSGGPTTTTTTRGSATAAPIRFAPPAGDYRYKTVGYVETRIGGSVHERREFPSETPTTVELSQHSSGATDVLMDVTLDDEFSERIRYRATSEDVRLVSVTLQESHHGIPTMQTVVLNPPALFGRAPLATGDKWEFSWSDPGSGIHGKGTGLVKARENLKTGIGSFEAVVLDIRQTLSGTAAGRVDFVFWIDPATGILLQRYTSEEITSAGETTRNEVTMTVERRPA